MQKEISTIVTSYQEQKNISNRGLARSINETLGIQDAISYNTIRNWKLGLAVPKNIALLYLLAQQDDGDLSDFAQSILDELAETAQT